MGLEVIAAWFTFICGTGFFGAVLSMIKGWRFSFCFFVMGIIFFVLVSLNGFRILN